MKQRVGMALMAMVALSAVAGYFSASESTRRYIVHLGKQVPYLPYRYFI